MRSDRLCSTTWQYGVGRVSVDVYYCQVSTINTKGLIHSVFHVWLFCVAGRAIAPVISNLSDKYTS
jgi:hypothetical protein